MSLKKNKAIIKVRKKLDSLDNRLLNLIKIRTKLVHQILQNKTSKKQIVDNARIKVILSNIKRKSLKMFYIKTATNFFSQTSTALSISSSP